MMKYNAEDIRDTVAQVLSEAKKKAKKSDKIDRLSKPNGYAHVDAFDFSLPNEQNLYRIQGGASWGPNTGTSSYDVHDNVPAERYDIEEAMLRSFIGNIISEIVNSDASAWKQVAESVEHKNIWEAALHWYDHQKLGLGHQTSDGIADKKKTNAKKMKGAVK